MRWRGRAGSSNVEDRRRLPVPGGGAGLGCGGVLLVLVISLLTGADPRSVLALLGAVEESAAVQESARAPRGASPADDPQAQFVSVVLRDTEDAWNRLFAERGRTYQEPTLVLFESRVSSACGMASSAVGPFYCPADGKLYLDLAFFRELDRRFGAPGDFAQAYVIAHEVGHHVQNLLGTSEKVSRAQEGARSRERANEYSIRLELQADCYAGVFGNANREYLDAGDVEEGLRAAAAIGDDTMQRQARGDVAPESWTHGSSAMRVRWLRRGLESGDPAVCDTFRAPL